MTEDQILSDIDNAPGGEVDEQVWLSKTQGQATVNLTGLLAKMRREGKIRRVRHEGELRTYVRVQGGE